MIDFEPTPLVGVDLPDGAPTPDDAWEGVAEDGHTLEVLAWGRGAVQVWVRVYAPEEDDAARFPTLEELEEVAMLFPAGALFALNPIESREQYTPVKIGHAACSLRQIGHRQGSPASIRWKLSGGEPPNPLPGPKQ